MTIDRYATCRLQENFEKYLDRAYNFETRLDRACKTIIYQAHIGNVHALVVHRLCASRMLSIVGEWEQTQRHSLAAMTVITTITTTVILVAALTVAIIVVGSS